jgi:hypothetical protein
VSFVRNILHDLVEKRLWPVALLLCAALIAVPTLLKKDPSPPAGAAAGPSTATLAEASVEASGTPARSRLDIGKERNPFQANTPKTKAPSTTTSTTPTTTTPTSQAPATGGTGGGTTTGGGGGGSGGGGTTTPVTPPVIPPSPAPGDTAWTLDVNFGQDGATKPVKALIPGRALPNTSNPVLIYLSATDGGKGATFLVSSDARAQGDGKCTPSEKTCTTITLEKGDTAFFDVAQGDSTVQYELELVDVVKRTVQ